MHPALSIIVFSTFSGVGFGISFWMGNWGQPVNQQAEIVTGIFALGWASIGLLSSLFHLRRPARAIRALSQWRSSWLSREGILSILALVSIFLYLSARFFSFEGMLVLILSWLTTILALATVYSTAMIYAQLKAVPAWNTILTPLVFIGFSLVGGSTFLFCFIPGYFHGITLVLNPVLLVGSWLLWLLWCFRRDSIGLGLSNVGTATRLSKFGTVRPFEPPHMGPNYLTSEMGYKLPVAKSWLMRGLAIIAGLLIPLVIYSLQIFNHENLLTDSVLFVLFCFTFGGIFISRWLFFTEARHTSMLYYYGD